MIPDRPSISRWRTLFAACLAFSMVAAACGSDSEGSSSDTTEGESPTTTEAKEAVTTEAEKDDEPSGEVTTVRWFVGLGTGSQEEQIPRQQELVDAFNESHTDIQIDVEFIPNEEAKSVLATQIAGGNPPDILGPVGREGSNAFAGQYLELDGLIESSGFDLSGYDPAQVELWRDDDGALRGLPFASFPSAIYYNRDLFDAADLPYPPSEYGPDGTATYGEGTEYEGVWDWDKLEEIATLLSIDSAGNTAVEAGFDNNDTVQWGYVHQWTEPPTAQGSFFGGGAIEQADGSAKVPAQWIEEWKWYHSAIHEKGIVPDATENDSDLLSGNAFNSGRVAMANTHLWYVCCLFDGDGNAKTFWDVATVPSYNGTVVSKIHADIFRLHKDTKNAEAAFEVLSFFQNEAALDLLTVYGAMPARNDIRADYFAKQDEQFTQGVNWDVLVAGLAYPESPSHERDMPNFLESDARIKELEPLIKGDPALDIDSYVTELEADLDAIWAAAG